MSSNLASTNEIISYPLSNDIVVTNLAHNRVCLVFNPLGKVLQRNSSNFLANCFSMEESKLRSENQPIHHHTWSIRSCLDWSQVARKKLRMFRVWLQSKLYQIIFKHCCKKKNITQAFPLDHYIRLDTTLTTKIFRLIKPL